MSKKVAFFSCWGVGDDSSTSCNTIEYGSFTHYYYTFNYDSESLISDVLQLVSNAARLQKNNLNLGRFDRLNAMKLIIKKLAQHDKIDIVYLVGFSHGSLLITAAYTLLKMDMDITRTQMEKIRMVTVGSPRMPHPKMMIADVRPNMPPPLVNIYHVNDKIIKTLRTFATFTLTRTFRVPYFKKEANINVNPAIQGTRTFDKSKTQYVPESAVVLLKTPLYVKSRNGFQQVVMPAPHAHGSVQNLACVFLYFISDNILEGSDETPSDVCNEILPMRAGSKKDKIIFKKSKKTYVVRADRQTKQKYIVQGREKVFLSSVRGQYRYIE